MPFGDDHLCGGAQKCSHCYTLGAMPQVVCAYHGWRFESDGTCSSIPQALDAKAAKTACASQRSCATAFPAIEAGGLLWVWPDASPGSEHGEHVLCAGSCGGRLGVNAQPPLEPGSRASVLAF
jgi:nitrite reductase/ring-hydroxylating ferredoxin subunit